MDTMNGAYDSGSTLKALGFYLSEAHETIFKEFMPTAMFDLFVTEPAKGYPILREQVERSGRVSEDAARRFDCIIKLIGDMPQGELKKHEEETLMCAYFGYEPALIDVAIETGRASR